MYDHIDMPSEFKYPKEGLPPVQGMFSAADINNPNSKNLEGKPICYVIKRRFTTTTTEWVTVWWGNVAFFPHLHLDHTSKEVFKVFRIEISAWELVLDVWVIDVCCREHALDWMEGLLWDI